MIRPLRRRHTLFAFAMAVGLPFFIVYRMLNPTPDTRVESLPEFVPAGMQSFPVEIWSKRFLWKGYPDIGTRLLASADGSGDTAVELTMPESVQHGNLLLYWSTFPPNGDTSAIASAYLMGSIGGNARLFPLPRNIRNKDGTLFLYSETGAIIISEAPIINPTP
ncbi:MAG TPA: hypothetical protein PKX94_06410 [Opitutales bacterium]|nr:hypothetical protein [Opitutales bacterium]